MPPFRLLPLMAALLACQSALASPAFQTRLIVRMKPGVASSATTAATVVSHAAGARQRTGTPWSIDPVRTLATGAHLVAINHTVSSQDLAALISSIAADPMVASVQPDHVWQRATAATPPDDPYFARYQWHLRAGNGAMETIGRDTKPVANLGGIDAVDAWQVGTGNGVSVAVIDTGLTHHPDLDLTLGDAGYDFISSGFISGRTTDERAPGGWDTGDWTSGPPYNTPDGCTTPDAAEDSSWHGTHVAGTIAELTNNATGMAGVAPGARVLPVRALGHCGGYESDIADAIEWASGGDVDGVPDNLHPAEIISMSLGGEGMCLPDTPEAIAIQDALARGATVVVAAGNSAANAAGYSPASCPGVITVGAVGVGGGRAFYSNWGSAVTIAAPGAGVYAGDAATGDLVDAGFVWSTVNTGTHEPIESAEGYAYGGMAGTSQATPHVAGTLALMVAAARAAHLPTQTPAQLKSLLVSTSRRFPTTQNPAVGAGIIDATAAVHAAAGVPLPPPLTVLARNLPVTNEALPQGGSSAYAIDVPNGARSLTVRTTGGSGDVTVYARVGQLPALDGSDATLVPRHPGNAEVVAASIPAPGRWFIRVVGEAQSTGFTVLGSFAQP
ncbi:S8 family serine peptidase [Luteibacter aegosomatissinici]|uniref:S8 family serine peptidase n=1 Tax=Luteibacter aegosomatissinici TaxID=2911539 RepID=UPI001FF75AB1|nr:S8 family serine peptidase [Luteibacter aegosomatissinici]UPG92679.1 S8 family serine peptidase [Luteibacter aegosomatissinici]